MSQSLIFVLREGIAGIMRARFSGLTATATVTVSLVLLGIFLILTVNMNRLIWEIKGRVELEVFLNDSMDQVKTDELEGKIRLLPQVETLLYVSKDDAVDEFQKLFNDNDKEDYFATLGHNPLPASFRIKLTEEFRNSEGAEAVVLQLQAFEEIREEDVVYRSEYLLILEKYISIAVVIDLLVGAILCVSALFLVSNNIRLIILSKKKIIETMRLVGATTFLVRMPLFIQGTFQGLCGGVLSALFLYGLMGLVTRKIPDFFKVDWEIYIIILNLGILLGFMGSFLAIRRHL
ncbi:permease-like cell division protein FtsX [bacterium]|nr:permease-like cell division protein FtsX [bacterium]